MSSFIHPHPPFSPPTPWNKIYRASEMDEPYVPKDYSELLVFINHFQNNYKMRDKGLDKNLIKAIRAFYYACVSFIDYQVGKIIDALDKKGILNETIIIFTSDHGEMLGDYNSFGKRCMLDPSANIPLVIRYPELIRAGMECNIPVSLVDIFPTLTEVSQSDLPGLDLDGISLLEIVKGNKNREFVYSQFSSGPTGLYMLAGKYEKIIYSASEDKWIYLNKNYSVKEDKNLISHPDYMNRAKYCKEKLIEFMKQNFSADIEENDFKKYPETRLDRDYIFYQDQLWCRETESIIPSGYKVNLKHLDN